MISSEYKQLHFEVYEIELPYCSVCTPRDGIQGVWNTPLTCEESSDSTYKLYFTKNSSPSIRQPSPSISGNSYLNSSIFKCVDSGTETTPLLKGGKGLASRSTMNVSMNDFQGDPGPLNTSEAGTFFGKLLARNVLEGKQIKTHYYTKDDTQSAPYIVKTSTHYITSAQLSSGKITISGKDGLKDLEKNSAKYPPPTDLKLSTALDLTDTVFNTEGSDFLVPGDIIKIGKELMKVVSIGSLTGAVTVQNRGDDITVGLEPVSKTEPQEHDAGDTIQICKAWNASIETVINNIFQVAGISTFVDFQQWSNETSEWNAGAIIKGVFHEPTNCDEVINKILTDYTLDMYLDQNTNKAVLSSVSQWLEPEIDPVEEGNDFKSYKEQIINNDRFSRAFIKTNKLNQTDNDDLTNYERVALFTDLETETSDFYGDIKTNEFEPSQTLQFNDAQVLVKRFVDRYSVPPKKIMFNMEERKVSNIDLGDVIDIRSRDKQLYDGTTEEAFNRAQVIKIQPKFNGIGRTYDLTCLSYIPEDGSNPEPLVYTNDITTGINIYNALGNPNIAVNAVVVFDGATFGSDNVNIPTIRAGALAAGSTVKIFCINGAKLSAKGGKGGDATITGDLSTFDPQLTGQDGGNGGNIYESDGIQTDLYMNYTPVDGYAANSIIGAPGGGGGGACAFLYYELASSVNAIGAIANAGGGGSGFMAGDIGIGQQNFPIRPSTNDESIENNGGAGDIASGGSGFINSITYGQGFPNTNSTITASSGSGGTSQDAGPADATYVEDIPLPLGFYRLDSGDAGLAGKAFTGGNIKVYNLDSASNRLAAGSSVEGVDYTLIDS